MNNIVEIVQVGIADFQLGQAPQHLRTTGLGSCVGVVIFDPITQAAGMAHIMLPNSNLSKGATFNQAKYADTAIPEMVSELGHCYGIDRERLQAKIAGGAQMFQFSSQSDAMRVGPRNVEAVKDILKSLNIPIIAEDVGGNNGRTIEFDPCSSRLAIRTIHKGMKSI
ncbi:chemotaxis protein CheD [Alkalihalobacillus sp. AL-G]|uniref:chemotaxis protein CheD n=1 Tax=Alkalihalobacillus sp. AL-G TaxID=2926399 RepID=UPI00272A42B5|nr:chemotaxis protein CheD [Alkalihalobacillus sp. AL-G]WLD95177.1 chemotaxis protein CheD [Alkalihalobacillus sp. AL-G]